MPDDFERFTRGARRVLLLAQTEAQRLKHEYIGLEHLLLGLAGFEQGTAATILRALDADLALIRERVQQSIGYGQEAVSDNLSLTLSTKRAIESAIDEARRLGHDYVGTEHLLAGLLRESSGTAKQILAEEGVTLDRVRAQMELAPRKISPPISTSTGDQYVPWTPDSYSSSARSKVPITISPVFALIVLVTLLAGYAIYTLKLDQTVTRLLLVVFVVGGWVVSLCLHEFGHALVAYVGGDHGVVSKGYLTLNPFKYTHGLLSIVFPLVFLAMGGIGLPGGAVYINPGAIRSKHMRSLTSAAGPIATTACAIVLLIPFMIGGFGIQQMNHLAFWAGLALLAFLQITALFFNLLPIPGLDGFGVIAPYLPEGFMKGVRSLGMLTYLIIFFLFFGGTPVSRTFWTGIFLVIRLVNLDMSLIDLGLRQFQFWAN